MNIELRSRNDAIIKNPESYSFSTKIITIWYPIEIVNIPKILNKIKNITKTIRFTFLLCFTNNPYKPPIEKKVAKHKIKMINSYDILMNL